MRDLVELFLIFCVVVMFVLVMAYFSTWESEIVKFDDYDVGDKGEILNPTYKGERGADRVYDKKYLRTEHR